VTVAVVTSTTQLAALPGNVPIPADLGVLPTDSVINVTQISTIDRQTLEERIGALPDWLLSQLDAGLQRALGLSRS
jgi:mRNA interferase MazF